MTVLITGANRGIGQALLESYKHSGNAVLGTSRSAKPPYLGLDVARQDSVNELALRLAGRAIDLLICNAGVYLDKGQKVATGYPPDMWAQSFAVNVTGVYLCIQALLPNLRRSSVPKIAIISSQMASDERAPGGSLIYRASKAAALNLGRNLAMDLKPDGIAVGIYHPGWVTTDMGGTGAEITPAESATGLKARFEALSLANTGCFETWDGRPHPY